MHLIVDRTRDDVRVIEASAWRLLDSYTTPISFSSPFGQFVVRMAYSHSGTVEYV